MKFVTGMAVAGLIALGSAGAALADAHQMSPMSMFQCNTACSDSWAQCNMGVAGMAMPMTPAEGMANMQMAAQTYSGCAEQARACYSACSGM